MRVQTLSLVWPQTLKHSHRLSWALSSTLNIFNIWMRVDEIYSLFWRRANASNISYTSNLTGQKHTLPTLDQNLYSAFSLTQKKPRFFFSKLVFPRFSHTFVERLLSTFIQLSSSFDLARELNEILIQILSLNSCTTLKYYYYYSFNPGFRIFLVIFIAKFGYYIRTVGSHWISSISLRPEKKSRHRIQKKTTKKTPYWTQVKHYSTLLQ